MKVSVIVPVHNEKDTIEEIIKRIQAVDIDKEIIIADDKSTDGTTDMLKEKFSGSNNIKLVFLEKNSGKGFTIRTALEYVNGGIVIIQDADLEYDPSDYIKLIKPIEEGSSSVVYGSRFMNLNIFYYLNRWFRNKIFGSAYHVGHFYLSNFIGIQVLNLLILILFGVKITDEATCYKAFRTDLLKSIKLRCMRFEFCPEVTAKVCKMGYQIKEVPISYQPRTLKEGKKLKWKDGLVAIYTILKCRFTE